MNSFRVYLRIFAFISTLIIVESNQTNDYLKSWQMLESFVSLGIQKFLNSSSVKAFVNQISKNDSINRNCSQSMSQYMDSIADMDYSALKMLDSSGKIPSGLLEGTMNDMGSYDQCLEVTNASYCMVDMSIPMPKREPYHSISTSIGHKFANFSSRPGTVFHHLSRKNSHFYYYLFYRLGLCLPSACGERDVQKIITSVLNDNKIGLNLRKTHCELKVTFSEKLKNLNVFQTISLSYVLLMVLIVMIATISHSMNGRKCDSILMSLSIQNSIKRIMSYDNHNNSMACLHGLRVFSINWIVFGHTYGWISFQIFRRSFAVSDIVTSFWFQPLMQGSLAVDTFFMISAFLSMNASINQFKSTKTFYITVYILHRIWRFLPPLLLTIAFTFIVELLGSGPIWTEIIRPHIDNCEKNWWTNALFVNYLIDSEHICLWHTWYLGCDLHFYIIALLVILPVIYGNKMLSIVNNCLLLSIATISTAIIIWVRGYPPTLIYSQPKVEERFKYVLNFYHKPYSHAGAYCVGLFLALILHSIKNNQNRKKFVLQTKYLKMGWVLALVVMTTLLFATYPWNNGSTPDPIVSVIYGSTHRTLWAAAMAWIILVCVTGCGGAVNTVLSFKPFIPLSRLTFSVYLLHPIVYWLRLGSIRERIALNHYDGLYAVIPTLVLTYVFALVCSLLCESPLLALESRLLKRFLYKDNSLKRNQELNVISIQTISNDQ